MVRRPYHGDIDFYLLLKRGSMSVDDRLKYSGAVKCLYNKSSKSDPKQVPGARNRLDDFVAAHIIQVYRDVQSQHSNYSLR